MPYNLLCNQSATPSYGNLFLNILLNQTINMTNITHKMTIIHR